jgi:hypothetical protein
LIVLNARVSDFEYTPECIVFDLLHIPLYHGWLVDPNDKEVKSAIGNCSYNQLVDKIINNKTSTQPELVTEGFTLYLFIIFYLILMIKNVIKFIYSLNR